MNRRHFLFASSSLTLLAACSSDDDAMLAAAPPAAGHQPPTLRRDANPLDNELAKYRVCTYCGMDRVAHHQTRHLVHYDDGIVDPTCSLHCTAISLAFHMDRSPQTIYVADYGAATKVKPLTNVTAATYLIGAGLPATMSSRSKIAFASIDSAVATRTMQGGALGTFDDALAAAYADMTADTQAIRQRRAEERLRMLQEQQKKKKS